MKLIIASNNKGKIKEYKDIFEPLGFQVLSQSEANIHLEVKETGTTFEQNAVLKARSIYEISHGCVISEDGNGKTTASMPLSFKETYSHRAKAVKKLMDYLRSR